MAEILFVTCHMTDVIKNVITWFQWMLNLASHLYRLGKKWVPKLIPVVPPVLFFPSWIQYHYYDLKLLFDSLHLNKTLLNCFHVQNVQLKVVHVQAVFLSQNCS